MGLEKKEFIVHIKYLNNVLISFENILFFPGYLEYDHPEIAVTMKTKEEINVMLSLAKEIVKVFRLKGILHKIEGSEINKVR